MIERPEFIDNRDGDTPARALDALLGGGPGGVAEGSGDWTKRRKRSSGGA